MRATVATEVLDAALRGGEPAAALAERCSARRAAAESALAAALKAAPAAMTAARGLSGELETQAESITRDLDTLAVDLDVLVDGASNAARRADDAALSLQALDNLAAALQPMLVVAQAIADAEDGPQRTVSSLCDTLASLENASRVASETESGKLRQMLPALQDHVSETTSMMQFRFLDLVSITDNVIRARESGARGREDTVVSPADALSRAGLLDEALRAIVTKLIKADVGRGIRAAGVFFSSRASGSDGPALEWSVGGDTSGELLEFDLDDLEDIPETDTDVMSTALDISNAASRALAVFDLLRDHVVGEAHSNALASAFHTWILDHVLPITTVLTSVRPEFEDIGVAADTLHTRVQCLSASARVLEAAMHSRGADPARFFINIDTAAVEASVAGECRGVAVLNARRAIGTFADARHNASLMTSCPLSAQEYVPVEERTLDYFPPCIISQGAGTVLDVFSRTRTDSLQALSGGSKVVGNALMRAAYECVDAYRVDVPLQHGDDIRASLRLKALYYNDCLMLRYACKQADAMDREQAMAQSDGILSESTAACSELMGEVTAGLKAASDGVMLNVRRTAEKSLMDNLNSACRNGALGNDGTVTRIQRGSALTAAFNVMRELVEVFSDIIPTEIAEVAAASLCEKYLRKLCDAVMELDEIVSSGCDQIDAILRDAIENTQNLMRLVRRMEEVREGRPEPEILTKLGLQRRRAGTYRHIVAARMEEIVTWHREGKYEDSVTRDEVEAFLLKIFEDTPLRATFISELDISKEAEEEEWGDAKW